MDPGTLYFGSTLALAAVASGIVIGVRLSRSQRRALQRKLAQRELALLDARSGQAKLKIDANAAKRREALLSLIMRKLSDSESRVRKIEGVLDAQERRHGISAARLEVETERAVIRAHEATLLAGRATTHLKRFEAVSTGPQPITACEPKCDGTGDTHAVRVIDQGTFAARRDSASRVSTRNFARLNTLRPSNELRGIQSFTGLQTVDGITPALERRLNEAGIHRVEQLADLSDHDADALHWLMKTGTLALGVDWQRSARRARDERFELPIA